MPGRHNQVPKRRDSKLTPDDFNSDYHGCFTSLMRIIKNFFTNIFCPPNSQANSPGNSYGSFSDEGASTAGISSHQHAIDVATVQLTSVHTLTQVSQGVVWGGTKAGAAIAAAAIGIAAPHSAPALPIIGGILQAGADAAAGKFSNTMKNFESDASKRIVERAQKKTPYVKVDENPINGPIVSQRSELEIRELDSFNDEALSTYSQTPAGMISFLLDRQHSTNDQARPSGMHSFFHDDHL